MTARRETILRAGLLDEALRSSEDFDLWLRIVKQGGRIAYHRRELARYRSRRGSLSADPVWMCQHILKVFDKAARTLEIQRRASAKYYHSSQFVSAVAVVRRQKRFMPGRS